MGVKIWDVQAQRYTSTAIETARRYVGWFKSGLFAWQREKGAKQPRHLPDPQAVQEMLEKNK